MTELTGGGDDFEQTIVQQRIADAGERQAGIV